MRAFWSLALLAACGNRDAAPSTTTQRATPANAPKPTVDPSKPLVMVLARDAKVAARARAALEKAGMRVEDAKPLDDAFNGPLFFGSIDTPPHEAAPPGVAARWKKDAQLCAPAKQKCPTLKGSPDCEDLMRCTHTLLMSLREDWIRELGATAWITVIAGTTEKAEGFEAGGTGLYAKAWGHKPCELTLRTLRVGAESAIMTLGSDAPLPSNADEAATLAGELAVRIARGEGRAFPREAITWVKPPENDAEIAALLGCR
jgi:hypothetical protein